MALRDLWAKKGVRTTVYVLGALVAVYILYMLFARWDNGTDVDVYVVAGTNPDGSMFFRCDPDRTTPGVCSGGDQAVITVGKRDRVSLTAESLDGGGRAHDLKLESWAYGPLYPWVEMELHDPVESTTFTAWKAGTFEFKCELPGHADAGMRGTFVVN